jgi:hypothetical protein
MAEQEEPPDFARQPSSPSSSLNPASFSPVPVASDGAPSSSGPAAATSEPILNPRTPLAQDFNCPVCLKLLYEPSTTACGHSYCRACLQHVHLAATQSMTLPQCPLCRSPLGIAAGVEAADVAVSVLLQTLLEAVFPAECAERRAEVAADALELLEAQRRQEAHGGGGGGGGGGDTTEAAAAGGAALLRLFVLDSMLPGQHLVLNVFEPRYLAMVEEVLREPGRRFGMVGSDAYRYRGHRHRPYVPLDHGVEVVIEQCVGHVCERACRDLTDWMPPLGLTV